MINGTDVVSPVADTPFQIAQKGLIAQLMKIPMHPNQAAISAYANGILQSARVSALVDFVVGRFVTEEQPIEALTAIYEGNVAEHLRSITAELKQAEESQTRIQLASSLARN